MSYPPKFRQLRLLPGQLALCGSLALAGVLVHPPLLLAQVTTAALSGTVQDASGARIPNAQIILKNTLNGDTRTVTSDGSGSFAFASVPTGNYSATISAPGFQAFQETQIHLDPGDQRSLRDIKMVTGGSTEQVTVTADDHIDLDSGESSSLISAEQIKHLSVEGRDVTELFKILPGFGISNGNGSVTNTQYDPSQVSVNGALGSYAANGTPLNGVALLSDGADITDPGNFGAAIQNVNYEQVSEVKVQTSSFTADTAHGPIVVNAVGKSGGDQFHGELYTYARTSQLNSTDWLSKYLSQAKPPDRQVYPGFILGGPVIIPGTSFNHNKKLTFFVGAEDYAQRNNYAYGNAGSAVLSALVPTAGMRAGDFSGTQLQQYLGANYLPSPATPAAPAAGGNPAVPAEPAGATCTGSHNNICGIPQTGPNGQALLNGNIGPYLDPGAKALINVLPLPNQPGGVPNAGGYNYVTTNLIDNDLWEAHGRVDDQISDRNKIFLVYTKEAGKNGVPQVEYYSPTGNLGGVNTPGGGMLSTVNSQIGSGNLTTIFTPTLTNELYGEGAYLLQDFVPKFPAALTAAGNGYPYKGLYANGSNVIPQFQDYGDNGLPVGLFPDTSHGGISAAKWIRGGGDNLTKLLGRHTVKVGIFTELVNNNEVNAFQNTNGAISNYNFPETFNATNGTIVHNTGTVGGGNGGNYLANFLEGHVGSFSQQNITVKPDLYFWNTAFYGQDHWALTPHLTVDLGVRFEHLAPWADAHGVGLPVWAPSTYSSTATGLLPGFLWHSINKNTPNAGLNTKWAYVEPRVGFAWDAYHQGQTILRGGFGIYRAHDSYNDATTGAANVDGQLTSTVTSSQLSDISNANLPINAGGSYNYTTSKVYGFAQGDDQQPQVFTYNAAIDQRMPFHSIVEIAYVGNYSNKLLNDGANQNVNIDDVNKLPIGSLFTPDPNHASSLFGTVCQPYQMGAISATASCSTQYYNDHRPYPTYQNILVERHNLYANYNALQVQWNKQQGRFLFQTNYSFSKALGILGAYNNGLPADPFNVRNNYQPEAYDHTHIFNASYSYDFGKLVQNRLIGGVANGWQLSGITQVESGAPLQSIYNPNFSLSGTIGTTNALNVANANILGTPDVSLQPRLTCDPSVHTMSHQYINGSCFALPTQIGTNGSYRYPYIHAPAFLDTDLTAAKDFKIGEKQSVQFRFAAFNFINHANTTFTSNVANEINLNITNPTPNATLASATNQSANFGLAPLRVGRRVVELALKYNF